MTPLSMWNPHNVTKRMVPRTKNLIFAGGKNGKSSPKALNGVNENKYYMTPDEFYGPATGFVDPADTGNKFMYVVDQGKIPRKMRAAGYYIHMPSIKGVGVLRQRYPIMPVHEEGGNAFKELAALKQIVTAPQKYKRMFYEDTDKLKCKSRCPGKAKTKKPATTTTTKKTTTTTKKPTTTTTTKKPATTKRPTTTTKKIKTTTPTEETETESPGDDTTSAATKQAGFPGGFQFPASNAQFLPSSKIQFITQPSDKQFGPHQHYFSLSGSDYKNLTNGQLVMVVTEDANGHVHRMTLYRQGNDYMMGHCDCGASCADGHGQHVFPVAVFK